MTNYRFSGYQYETSPRKLEPEYNPQKNPYSQKKSSTLKKKEVKKNIQQPKQKRKLKSGVKVAINIALIFSALFVISYRNSAINESFARKENLVAKLGIIQKENEQLQVNIENNLNLSNIEKIAKEKLGMQKLDNNQKVYVSLPKKDYVEPASEEIVMEQEINWLQRIINFFMGK